LWLLLSNLSQDVNFDCFSYLWKYTVYWVRREFRNFAINYLITIYAEIKYICFPKSPIEKESKLSIFSTILSLPSFIYSLLFIPSRQSSIIHWQKYITRYLYSFASEHRYFIAIELLKLNTRSSRTKCFCIRAGNFNFFYYSSYDYVFSYVSHINPIKVFNILCNSLIIHTRPPEFNTFQWQKA